MPAADGGRGGIRTHGTVSRTPVFKTGSLNHSDTLPTVTSVYSLGMLASTGTSSLAAHWGRHRREAVCLPPEVERRQQSLTVAEELPVPVVPMSATPELPAVPVPCMEVSAPQLDVAAPASASPAAVPVVTPGRPVAGTPGTVAVLAVALAAPDASDVPVTAAPPEVCATAAAEKPNTRAAVVSNLPDMLSSWFLKD